MRHTLTGAGQALHGHFDRGLEPSLSIDPGDQVAVTTLDCWWSSGPAPGGPPDQRPRVPEHYAGAGHALTGPIEVRGAEPGDVVAVRFDAIEPTGWGTTVAGGRLTEYAVRYGIADDPVAVLDWDIDAAGGTARNQLGHTVALRPFFGVTGLAPAAAGKHSTIPPRRTGGNLDCRELVAGSTLYLPVAVPGALLSVGDGHAAQGDGEVGGTAVECAMNGMLTVDLARDLPVPVVTPLARTPAGWITFGLGKTVDEATFAALDGMFELLQARYGLTRAHAAALASVVVDVRITQIVNQTVGAHAVLPEGAVR